MEFNHRIEMKAENQRKILNLINKHPMFRAAIATELGLTQASVSQLTEELISDGIIGPAKDNLPETAVGRRPEMLDICADWGMIAGISIDREQVTVGLVDLKGNPKTECLTLPMDNNYSSMIDLIARSVFKLQAVGHPYLLGAGVSVPGPMDSENGRILEPPGFPPSWYHLPLRNLLEEKLRLPVYVEHNARAFAQAEICLGAGAGYSHFVILNVNSGIGSGLVLNGEVYTGAHGIGCEIGHMALEPNGRLCFCGRRGCLEQYASASAILHEIRRFRQDIDSWHTLVDLAYCGDSVCNQFLELEASYFGEMIRSLVSFCDLEAVLFTGQIAYRSERLFKLMRQEAEKKLGSKLGCLPEIKLSAIPGNPYLTSSAAVVLYHLYYKPFFYYEKKQERRKYFETVCKSASGDL